MEPSDFDEIVAAVRRFVRDEVVPREPEIEESDTIPATIRDQAIEMGLFGYALPERFGGLETTMTEDVRLALEFGYTAPAFRSMFGTNNGIAGQMIARFGTEDQQEAFLPRLVEGLVASFALTEPEAGSDPSGLRTTARRDGDDWVINGNKRYITNAALSDVLVVFARTEPGVRDGISAFLVDTDSPGVTVGPKDAKMGQRGAWTSDVTFADVRVRDSRLVGGVAGQALEQAKAVLSRGRLHIAALCVGLAQRIRDEMVAHAAITEQGGRPIGHYQLVQALLADSHAELLAGHAMVVAIANSYDRGEDTVVGPSSAKLFCSEMVGRVADRGVQVHGGMGYMRSTPVERFYRDARLYRIYEGTSEIQRLVIGRGLLKELRSTPLAPNE